MQLRYKIRLSLRLLTNIKINHHLHHGRSIKAANAYAVKCIYSKTVSTYIRVLEGLTERKTKKSKMI